MCKHGQTSSCYETEVLHYLSCGHWSCSYIAYDIQATDGGSQWTLDMLKKYGKGMHFTRMYPSYEAALSAYKSIKAEDYFLSHCTDLNFEIIKNLKHEATEARFAKLESDVSSINLVNQTIKETYNQFLVELALGKSGEDATIQALKSRIKALEDYKAELIKQQALNAAN